MVEAWQNCLVGSGLVWGKCRRDHRPGQTCRSGFTRSCFNICGDACAATHFKDIIKSRSDYSLLEIDCK